MYDTDTIARPARRLPASILGHDIGHCTSVSQALAEANMDWTINTHPATELHAFIDDELVTTSMPGRNLLMRSDNNVVLGTVGSRYRPVDNAEAFALADSARQLGATFAYAGETDHGRWTYLTMDIPEARVHVGGHDVVDFGLVLRANHDGGGSITGEVTAVRQVCTNGLTVGSVSAPNKWTIRHTRTALNRLQLAEDALRHAFIFAKEFAAVAEQMVSTPMSGREFEQMIETLFPTPPEEATPRVQRAWLNRVESLTRLFHLAETQEEGRGTRWAAFNAVAEWEDWFRPARGGDMGRARRNFQNPVNTRTQAAFELLSA